MDSKEWEDIGYNFLLGSDGLIYEGRGWNIVGRHTKNYNSCSVGIAFIGCYVKCLPPAVSINNTKLLIDYGVKMGYISKNYRLLAHTQCNGFASSGERLFEEIQTWENWDCSIRNVQNEQNC